MNQYLEKYVEMIPFLKENMADVYNVILFDLAEEDYPVVEQGDWSNSHTECIRLKLIENYEGIRSGGTCYIPDGNQLLKISSYIIREDGIVAGALVICLECDMVMRSLTMLQSMLGRGFGEETKEKVELSDIRKVIEAYGTPVGQLKSADKRELFLDLDDAGVFRLKGAVSEVAKVLNMSEKSAYRYLSDMRKVRQ